MKNKQAFTLIELLVVVLIIGILAAVAVPQYEKAVWKSRTMQLITLAKSVTTAQQTYFLANGTYPTQFSELDLGFDNLTPSNTSTLNATGLVSSTDAVRYNALFELNLRPYGVHTWFRTGKYKGCGIRVDYETGEMTCMEWLHYYKGDAGDFCKKIMKSSEMNPSVTTVRYYPM